MTASDVNPPAPADHRGTIHVEEAEVVGVSHHAGDQHILRLRAPVIAAHVKPGNFVHLRCDEGLAMRRPMSIMYADAEPGWFDVLFKVRGIGTALLARRVEGDTINAVGPIGTPFRLSGYRRHALLIGGGVGIPPMVHLARHKQLCARDTDTLVLMGSEVPFPFTTRPSQILIRDMPDGVIATIPLLEDWGIACRLASQQGYPGCYEGFVTDLARCWIDAHVSRDEDDIEIFACGPTPMLKEVAALARRYRLRCQISLEEYMACGVGGCAGCTVEIQTEDGPAMQRVCVDGPVFDAATVVFPDYL